MLRKLLAAGVIAALAITGCEDRGGAGGGTSPEAEPGTTETQPGTTEEETPSDTGAQRPTEPGIGEEEGTTVPAGAPREGEEEKPLGGESPPPPTTPPGESMPGDESR